MFVHRNIQLMYGVTSHQQNVMVKSGVEFVSFNQIRNLTNAYLGHLRKEIWQVLDRYNQQ